MLRFAPPQSTSPLARVAVAKRIAPAHIEDVEHLPTGALTFRYSFMYAFWRQAIYDRFPPRRRSRLRSRAGEAPETFHSETSHGNPSELALHFEAGGRIEKAANP